MGPVWGPWPRRVGWRMCQIGKPTPPLAFSRITTYSGLYMQNIPDYESMLKMDLTEFEHILMSRIETDRPNLLREMTDHEDKTWSFAKSIDPNKATNGYTTLMYSVFDKEKQIRTIDVLDQLSVATREYLPEDQDSQTGLVEKALMARAAVDWVATQKSLRT